LEVRGLGTVAFSRSWFQRLGWIIRKPSLIMAERERVCVCVREKISSTRLKWMD
jgi:hypothetical protein